ncbi:GNAT family N-acetyltransferase [Lacibacterium aquatile]|uniref:GNAT family N-acetyltransferase n=1 Tax=Lacibacterium aquatile TaxID=1168082 RepID=A0ABW5DRA2_9PROT
MPVAEGAIVRPVTLADEAAWRHHWAGYLKFYEVDLAPDVTDGLWARLHDPAMPMFALVAEFEGKVVGFVHGVVHYNTWGLRPICYLEDLYVDADVRGQRLGQKLIDAMIEKVKAEDWGRLYWHTSAINRSARILYDRYTPADMMVRYTLRY